MTLDPLALCCPCERGPLLYVSVDDGVDAEAPEAIRVEVKTATGPEATVICLAMSTYSTMQLVTELTQAVARRPQGARPW